MKRLHASTDCDTVLDRHAPQAMATGGCAPQQDSKAGPRTKSEERDGKGGGGGGDLGCQLVLLVLLVADEARRPRHQGPLIGDDCIRPRLRTRRSTAGVR